MATQDGAQGAPSTELLYFRDCQAAEFDAVVTAFERVAAVPGTETPGWAVALDRTAFYAGGGGQPSDRGWVGDQLVLEVGHDPERPGVVLHYLGAEAAGSLGAGLPAAGKSVHCRIDWARRFDLMQQHTGQHIISAVAMRDYGAPTTGFHLGEETATVDLAFEQRLTSSPQAVEGLVSRLEEACCAEVYADRPVRIHFVEAGLTPEAASQAGLALRIRERGPVPKGIETWRVIEIGGLDANPCGGTHVASTGEIGLVTLQRWEKVRDGLRFEFACGGRALRAHQWRRDALRGLAQALSVHEREASGQAIANLESAAAAQKELRAARIELLGYQAAAVAEGAEQFPGGRLVALRRDDLGPEELKVLATAVCAKGQCVALLASSGGGVPRLVFGRSDDIGQVNAGRLLSETMARLGGRGGGSPKLAQGGGGDPALLDGALEWAAGEAARVLAGC